MTGPEKINIIEALESGKSIEFKTPLGCKWHKYKKSVDGDLNFQDYEYRIQPEPREFCGALEFIEALKKHGGYLKVPYGPSKIIHYVSPSDISDSGIVYTCLLTNVQISYKKLLEDKIEFYDGTPCGIVGGS